MELMAKLMLCFFLLFGGLGNVVPARILFMFPHRFTSHYRAFSPLIDELAARGNQITAYVHPALKKHTPIENLKEVLVPSEESDNIAKGFNVFVWRNKSTISYIHQIWELFPPMTEAVLKTPELQTLMLSEEKFDLVIVEATFGQECFVAFGHKFNAPVINLEPLFVTPFVAQLAGIPHSFSYIPDHRLPLTDQMNLWQRAQNILIGLYDIIGGNLYYLPYRQENLMRKYFKYSGSETLPSLKELIANVSLHIVDSHPVMSYIRPYSPNVIDAAGMSLKSVGKLQDLQKFMDEATEGVVYFSLGSLIHSSMFPPHLKQILVDSMKSLKQRVIWKWDEEVEDAQHILTRSWLPQHEILAHPNCKLFITHGGFNSLVEAMSIGRPVIGLPFFADQFHNMVFYKHMGVGLEANLDRLTVKDFTGKIKQIIRTPSFAENAKRLSKIFHDEPQNSLEKATYWVEYVIRHRGAHHLKPASLKLPYYQYILLDVIAFCAISLLSMIYLLFWLTRKLVQFYPNSNKKARKLEEKRNKKHN